MQPESHAGLTFAAAAALLTVAPGLDTLLVLRTAAVEGTSRAMMAGLGICVGCLTWGLLVAIGLGAILQASHLAYTTLRGVGAAYLAFLGITLMFRRSSGTTTVPLRQQSTKASTSRAESPGRWFVRGLLTNLLNPKVGVFYITFLPQFIPAGVDATKFGMMLASIHAVEGLLWFAVLTLATRSISPWLQRPVIASSLDRVTGAVFIGFGAKLLLDRSR